MVKANMKMPDGTEIIIEGNKEEVANILGKLQKSSSVDLDRSKLIKHGSRMSISDRIFELKESGFFKTGKTLFDVKRALDENGYRYSPNVLSTQLIREIRKPKKFLRRLKEGEKYVYVEA